MKTAQLNKLYSKLTPQELAALAFEAAVRLDENELDAIVENVERKTYISVHTDYTRRIHGLQSLVTHYGIEYWRIRTLMLIACNMADNGNEEAENSTMQLYAKVLAIETALANICKHFKVDMAAIKKMAGCPEELAFNDSTEAYLVEDYTKQFTKAVMFD